MCKWMLKETLNDGTNNLGSVYGTTGIIKL